MRVERHEGIAEIWLDRPERHNALDLQMAHELRDAIDSLADWSHLRVVLLAAEGRSFCVGGNIAGFESAEDPQAAVRTSAKALNTALLGLIDLEVPVVARVQGAVAGAGVGLVLAADMAIASRAAHFTLGYTAIGFTPDAGVSWWLPRCVGQRRAAELLLTNRRLDAEDAAAIGLITEAVDDADLDRRIAEVTSGLAAGATGAHAATMGLLREASTTSLPSQLAREAQAIGAAAGSPEGREGVSAFRAARAARFHSD
jgi:2-(1,2-epoxy-1,2-dihydrophenyl)acetyl-CoA isomerase